MAFYDVVWYCNAGNQSNTGYYAVALRPQNTAVVAGQLARQFTAPAVGSERVFVCIVAGTTANTTDATWVLTRGAKTTDGTATWMECTGASAVNGDLADTPTWAAIKAIGGSPSLGVIIQRNSGASYQICTTAGTLGAAEPAFSNTAGTTTAESGGTAVWTSLGAVGNFTGGQAPHARLASALAGTWFIAGNTVYVGDNHAESAAGTISTGGTGSTVTVSKIICHNHAGNYPPASTDLATTATISTTIAAAINITTTGVFYFYGLTFIAGVGQSTGANLLNFFPSNTLYYFESCVFKLATTSISGLIVLNTTNAGTVLWNNCQVSFANAAQNISVGYTDFTWRNTAQVLATGSTVPTNLLGQNAANAFSNVVLEALDLSQWTSVFISASPPTSIGNWIVKDCKLNAAATFPNPANTGQIIQTIRADGGATAYKSARYAYEGTETTETSISRVGGAVDPTGQAQARKLVTTANSQWLRPFKTEPYAVWNPTTGANVTVTVYGTINAGALPNNDDIWMEVEYLGSSSFPQGTIVNTTKANLFAANAAVASDSSTWLNTAFNAWNPVDLLNMTLSNGNLTAVSTSSPSGARANTGLATGKYYWEVTVSTWAQLATAVGFALGTAAFGVNATGSAFVAKGGAIGIAGANTGSSLGARSSGDTIGIALDLSNNLCWFRVAPSGNWNGSGTANPVTGAGGVSISSIATGPLFPYWYGNAAGEVVTANFGASAFSGAVPSGFTAGFPAVWSSFKLTRTLSSPQPGMAGYIHARVRAAKLSTIFYLDPQITLS